MRQIRFTFWEVILGLIVMAGLAGVVYLPNYSKFRQLQKANQKLQAEIDDTRKEILDLREKLAKLGKDPRIMEEMARNELGVARDGEIVVDIEE